MRRVLVPAYVFGRLHLRSPARPGFSLWSVRLCCVPFISRTVLILQESQKG